MSFLIDRLKEKSTWMALVGLAVAAFGISQEEGEAIAGIGIAIATAVGVFTREEKLIPASRSGQGDKPSRGGGG